MPDSTLRRHCIEKHTLRADAEHTPDHLGLWHALDHQAYSETVSSIPSPEHDHEARL